jgi:hypothetical protein
VGRFHAMAEEAISSERPGQYAWRAGTSALPDSTHLSQSEATPFLVWTHFAFGGLRERRIKSSIIS